MTKPHAPCTLCHRDMAGGPDYGRLVCAACENGLAVDLSAIVDAAALASLTPTGSSSGSQGGRRPVPTSRPPVTLDHIDPALARIEEVRGDPSTATTILALLESWARAWRGYRGLAQWGVVTEAYPTGAAVALTTVVADLRRHLPVIAATSDFPVSELADHVRRCLRTLQSLDPTRERVTTWRVPCPADAPVSHHHGTESAEQGEVGTERPPEDSVASTVGLRACGHRLHITPGDLNGDTYCERCGSRWTIQRLLLVALNDPRVTIWGYPSDIADALGITARSLRRWAEAGEVGKRGSLYDTGAAYRRHAVSRVA